MPDFSKRLVRSCGVLLRGASILVPRSRRSEWLVRKRKEFWHWIHFLAESGRLNRESEREIVRHCWRQFGDALWCRLNRAAVLGFLHSYPAGPSFCLICTLLPLFILLAARPWPLRSVFHCSSANPILTVTLDRDSHWLEPELLRDAAADWTRADHQISDAETYAWRSSVISGPGGKQFIASARTTPGLLQLLGATYLLGQPLQGNAGPACFDCVVLSHAVWNEQFHGNADLSHAFVFLNGRRLHVVGVLSDRFRFLDPNVQAYVPFDSSTIRMPGAEWSGVVLRIANGLNVKSAQRQIRREVEETRFPWPVGLNVTSLNDIHYRNVLAWFAVGSMATLVLVCFNWRTFRQLCTTSPRRSLGVHLKWWAFFAAKSGSLAILTWLFSVDVVQVIVEKAGLSAVRFAGGASIWIFVVGLWIALGWSIRDQNGRCRFCLKRLRTEIVLGEAIFALLEPTGCDLFCDSAHGMLHVPAMQLSSLDSERWIDFDESWQVLAHDAPAGG